MIPHLKNLACWAAVLCAVTSTAHAELQIVNIGGEIRIRGNYWDSSFNPRITPTVVGPEVRIPASDLVGRAIGDVLGGQNVTSHWDWDDSGDDYKLYEQRTTLHLSAEFTEEVCAFIELEHFQAWGTEFRSNYLSGYDGFPGGPTNLHLYQSYIDASEMWGTPLRLRIGRQELNLGSGWLVGNNSNHPEFAGLSFDGVRATWGTDLYLLDAFVTKLAERSGLEQDGDIHFSGIYASYRGFEDIEVDAYWLWLRDARNIEDNQGLWINEFLEDLRGVDDYGATNLHTLGLRVSGQGGNFDFQAEAAYQFGEASHAGSLFKPFLYGDDDAEYGHIAADVEVGYTFASSWQPRVYLGGAYLGGEDHRDLSFWEWVNPLRQPEASVSFSRLFSNRVYSPIIDEMSQLSNAWIARAGVGLHPTEQTTVDLGVAYFQALETFDVPPRLQVGPLSMPLAGPFTFWTWENDDSLGVEASLRATYRYSDDLEIQAGWHHFFAEDGLTSGNYTDFHGLLFSGGTDDQDTDYLYVQTRLTF